ncbi:arylamine N-acetyltransferase, pineal gland isozyme NAT-10-like isoform X2 [Pleurodeles waltl]
MNLEDYFSRIHFKGSPVKCTFQNVMEIFQHHIRAVPFENLSIHCEEVIQVNIDAVYNKIVRKRRGGWCIEQNHLLYWVLKTMGYEVTMHEGNVYHPLQAIYSDRPSHLILKVVVEGKTYIVDAGFGASYQMWEPMELISGKDQPQIPGIFRLTEVNGFWYFEKIKRKQHIPDEQFSSSDLLDNATHKQVYRFTLLERTIEDFIPVNTFLQISPDSLFKKKSICTLQLTDGVRSLVGWTLTEMRYNYKDNMDLVEFTTFNDEDVEMVLRDKFNLTLEKRFVPVNSKTFYTI